MFSITSRIGELAISPLAREQLTYLAIVILITSPFWITYCLSSYRFHTNVKRASTSHGYPTPVVPYWVPFLGHTIPFVFNTAKYMQYLTFTFKSTPVKIYLGGQFIQFIPHGEPIATLHRKSRILVNSVLTEKFMSDAGVSLDDQIRGEINERSGMLPQPNPGWEHLPDDRRWNYIEHKMFLAHLSGRDNEVLSEKMAEGFSKGLVTWAEETATKDSDGWISVPDLTEFMRGQLFHAATSAMFGDELLRAAPELCVDFWSSIDRLPQLFRKLPRWLAPEAYRAREKVMASLVKWEEVVSRDGVKGGKEGEWDSLHGSALTQARHRLHDQFGISKDGRARFHFAFMFAQSPNTIYATVWALLDVLQDKNLTSRVISESTPCFQPGSLAINAAELNKLPLLSSIFMETLRLRTASPIARTPIDDTFRLGNWKLDKDVHIIASTWFGAHDASFWNEGPVLADARVSHPVDSFWAERFLEYPGDATSGPLKKNKHVHHPSSVREKTTKTAEDDKHARVVTSGTAGHWVPFGGGLNMCPGRHFAKIEVMVGVAMMLRAFEFEGLWAEGVEPDMNNFPFGTLPPKGRIGVRVRLRDLVR